MGVENMRLFGGRLQNLLEQLYLIAVQFNNNYVSD